MPTITLRSATGPGRAPSKVFARTATHAGPSRAIRFDLVSGADAFETLEPEWDALFASSGRPTQVFQTFAWNWHWCRHYLPKASPGSRSRLAVVTGRLSGRLVLVLPLVLERVFGLRRLAWMGDPVSQYGDALVAPEADDDATLLAAWTFALSVTGADVAHCARSGTTRSPRGQCNSARRKVIATEQAPYLDLSARRRQPVPVSSSSPPRVGETAGVTNAASLIADPSLCTRQPGATRPPNSPGTPST